MKPSMHFKLNINTGLLAKWLVYLPLIIIIGIIGGALDGFIKVCKQANDDIISD